MKKYIPHLVLGLFVLWIISALRPAKPASYMDDVTFGQLTQSCIDSYIFREVKASAPN